MLLRAIMEIPFQAPAFQILRLHQPLPRGAQLVEPRPQVGAQPHVLEHQSRLVREIVDQLLLDRCQRLAATLAHAQRAEEFALVTYLHRAGHALQAGNEPFCIGSDSMRSHPLRERRRGT